MAAPWAIAAVLLAGCTTVTAHPPIAGEWRVTAINGEPTGPGGPYRMRFEPGRVSGQLGCNHFGGDYRLSGEVITTGAVAMTEMACAPATDGPDPMAMEARGAAILSRPMRMRWSGDRLRLSNEAGQIDLTR